MGAAFLTSLQIEKVGPDRWRLLSPLQYRSVIYPGLFVVPRGFETDLASVPVAIQSLLPKVGNYDAAAVLHDAGYANRLLTASQRRMFTAKPVIDKLFHEACLSLGVGRARAWAMYQAVKLWGDPLGHPSRRAV